jgi:hypothetical protein
MKTRILSVILLILGVLLFSCGTNNAEQIRSADALRTEAVSTYASSLTETLVAVPSSSPTLTLQPTLTLPAVTLTVAPSPTSNSCYDLLWLKDLTIPDGTRMKANETFTKTWLVQNNGGCAWAPGFTFVNVGGDPMRGEALVFKEPIPVGLQYKLSIQLVVPSGINGLIQSSWRMAYEPGMYFGDTLSVNILVGNPVTPTATNPP